MIEQDGMLQLRPDMKNEVELNLEHLGRQIIHRGELQRPGTYFVVTFQRHDFDLFNGLCQICLLFGILDHILTRRPT
jgi:hypothetical protein